MRIPFNRIHITGREIDCLRDCIEQGQLSGDGYYSKLVQKQLENDLACPRVLLTTSGTSALELAMLCLDLAPGDEVIMPSFTFASTANAVLLRGARPVFAEIDSKTLMLDPVDAAARINSRTRAVLAVHYGGIASDLDRLLEVTEKAGIALVEDAAQGVGAYYKGKPLGTKGIMGCYSFHATKNIVSGEGGALLINNPRPELLQKAEMIYEKGTDRRRFLRGEVDRYTWQTAGSSFPMADLLAAFLYAQLEEADAMMVQRQEKFNQYMNAFAPYEEGGLLQLPYVPDYARSNYHIFHMLCPAGDYRDRMLVQLRQEGIEASFHFVPLHSSPMGGKLGYEPNDLPISMDVSHRLIRLPLYPDLSEAEQNYIIDKVSACLGNW